jgi:maleylpyruvate isomerase
MAYDEPASSDASIPLRHLEWVADAQARFQRAIEGLDDRTARAPSLLPGWTRGHLLTHVARNADSHRRRAQAAARGEIVEQYAGGYAGRAAEIDRDADKPAPELVEDVRTSAESLDAAWRTLPVETWNSHVSDVAGRMHLLRVMPARRWRELEIHLVDLNIGPSSDDWPGEFVQENLPVLRSTLESRLPADAVVPELTERDELAWLTGRLQHPGLPELLSWD